MGLVTVCFPKIYLKNQPTEGKLYHTTWAGMRQEIDPQNHLKNPTVSTPFQPDRGR